MRKRYIGDFFFHTYINIINFNKITIIFLCFFNAVDNILYFSYSCEYFFSFPDILLFFHLLYFIIRHLAVALHQFNNIYPLTPLQVSRDLKAEATRRCCQVCCKVSLRMKTAILGIPVPNKPQYKGKKCWTSCFCML